MNILISFELLYRKLKLFDMTQEELFDKVFDCIHGCIDGTFLHCNIKDGVCRCDNCEYFKQTK